VEPPEAVSVSHLNLYLTCSLKYRFQYVDRLPKLFRSAGMVFGSAIHKALEWLHKERKAGRNPPLDQLLRTFEADWHAQCLDNEIRFANGDDPENLIVKGKELLSEYYRLPPSKVKDAELFFQVPLVNPETGEVLAVPLRGVIDLIEEGDVIGELKTSQKSWSLADLPDNLQLTAYSYAYEVLFGRPPKDLKVINLVRAKKPRVETLTTGREKKDYERLFHLAKEVLRGIEAGVFIPNRGCWLCKDCEFERDCLEWTGNEEEGGAQNADQRVPQGSRRL
jgi:putative RecB family exonuclease